MTSNPKLGWPVQNPSPDFAERTVTAILRDRDERRQGGSIARRPPYQDRARGRWLLIAAAAAVTMAGGAFAWTALPRAAKHPTASSSAAAPPRPVEGVRHAIPSTPSPLKEMPPKSPAPPAIAPLRRRETPPTPSSTAPAAERRVIVPRCNCQEAICDCLEAH